MKSKEEIESKIAELSSTILDRTNSMETTILLGARIHALRWVLSEME